jgi:hypothetical protein
VTRAQWATLVHASDGSWATLCRPGQDRGRYTFATSDPARVTCPACRQRLNRLARAPQEKRP